MQHIEMLGAKLSRALLVGALSAALVVTTGSTGFTQSANPFIGTWKLNVAKSKVNVGSISKSSTTKIEAAGAGIKVTVDAVGGDGTVRHWVYTANYDGKDVPIAGNSQYGDTIAATRVDASTTRNVYKAAGKVTTTQTSTVAADGKTRTVTSKGTDAKGQLLDNVLFYDKQ